LMSGTTSSSSPGPATDPGQQSMRITMYARHP